MTKGFICAAHVHSNIYHIGKFNVENLKDVIFILKENNRKIIFVEKVENNLDEIYEKMIEQLKSLFPNKYEEQMNCFLAHNQSLRNIMCEFLDIQKSGYSCFEDGIEYLPIS